jgi:hypothetical protein
MYKDPTSLAEGRLPETFGGWSGGRPLRAWLVTTHSGGSGQRAGRHYDRSARCSLDGASLGLPAIEARPREQRDWQPSSKGERDGIPEARPGADAETTPLEMPRWSAERRAGQRHWPVISGEPEIGPTARRATGAAFRTSACRRSASPRCGEGHEKKGVPGASQKNTGSAALALFTRSPHEREARLRASSTRYGNMRDRTFGTTNVRVSCTTAPHIATLMRATYCH